MRKKLRVAQRTVALEASAHDNTQVISEVTDVPAIPGCRHTNVPQRFYFNLLDIHFLFFFEMCILTILSLSTVST
jgi:hypothetical protein